MSEANEFEEKILPKSKRKRTHKLEITCPICGLTLRDGQLSHHYEMEKDKLMQFRKKRHPTKQRQSQSSETSLDRSVSNSSALRQAKEALNVIRRHRLVWKCTGPSVHQAQTSNGGPGPSSQTCPICGVKVLGGSEELMEHVDECLAVESDEVDDEEGNTFDEYEWCGERRIRISTLVQTSSLPDHVVVKPESEEGSDIDVEGDKVAENYGPQQYLEADVIPCGERDEEVPSISKRAELTTKSSETGHSTERVSPSKSVKGKTKMSLHEQQLQHRCSVCMDTYCNPLVSVQCWHVMCEECWLRALGAKKLCPKCNKITLSGDLRRIFL